MNTYTIARCPKCNSSDNFRSWNRKLRQDDGFCRVCHHKSGYDDFIMSGEDFDKSEKEFDKDRYYARKQTV